LRTRWSTRTISSPSTAARTTTCLAKYEEFLKTLEETTQDATEEIREIVGNQECFCGEVDADEEIDIVEEDEEF
jgi:hypothetical protein